MMIPTPVTKQQEARRKTLAAELRISTKAKLFDLLQAAGIARVTVAFDGQGDSGQIEDISAFSEANKPIKLPGKRLSIQTAKSRRNRRRGDNAARQGGD